jgi:hypothetical protein
VNQPRMALKNPTGWFAAGREVARAMALVSDGAFKVYMHICLTADRSSGRLKIAHGDLAIALKKSRRSIVHMVPRGLDGGPNLMASFAVCDLHFPAGGVPD